MKKILALLVAVLFTACGNSNVNTETNEVDEVLIDSTTTNPSAVDTTVTDTTAVLMK